VRNVTKIDIHKQVDMILAFAGKDLAVIQSVMLAQPFQRVVAAKGVRVVDRSFSCMLPDMRHRFIGCHLLHDFGIHASIALQKAENDAFAGRTSALAFAPATEIRLVNLDLAFQSAGFQLSHVIERFSQMLVDAAHHLVLKAEIIRHAIGRLLVEPGDDADLLAQSFERFLFSADLSPASHIAEPSLTDTERAAEYALSTPQKVGRTIENILLLHNHEDIPTPRGYETH